MIVIFVLVHLVSFFSLTLPKYHKLKNSNNSEKYQQSLVWAFFSSFISPCIVVHPKTKTLLISNFSSALAHLELIIFILLHPTYLKFPIDQNICFTLLGLLFLSILPSIILHYYSKHNLTEWQMNWDEEPSNNILHLVKVKEESTNNEINQVLQETTCAKESLQDSTSITAIQH